MGIIRPNGHAVVYHLRDAEHDGAQLLLQLALLGFKRGKALGVGLDLRLDCLGLCQLGGVLLRLAHAHLLGEGVAGRAQLVGLGDGRTQARVVVYRLVNKRQLGVLKLLAYVLAHGLRVLAHKFDVQHVFLPLYFFIQALQGLDKSLTVVRTVVFEHDAALFARLGQQYAAA